MLRNLLLRRGVHTNEHMIAFIVQARKRAGAAVPEIHALCRAAELEITR